MAQALPHASKDIILIPQHLQAFVNHVQLSAFRVLLEVSVLNALLAILLPPLDHAWNAWKIVSNVMHLMSIFATIVVLDTIWMSWRQPATSVWTIVSSVTTPLPVTDAEADTSTTLKLLFAKSCVSIPALLALTL